MNHRILLSAGVVLCVLAVGGVYWLFMRHGEVHPAASENRPPAPVSSPAVARRAAASAPKKPVQGVPTSEPASEELQITGVTVDAKSGVPVAGVRVVAECWKPQAKVECVSGADGGYILSGLSSGGWKLGVNNERWTLAGYSRWLKLDSSSQPPPERLEVTEAGEVSGHVTDLLTGAALSGVVVRIGDESTELDIYAALEAVTDSSGAYRIRGLGRGRVRLGPKKAEGHIPPEPRVLNLQPGDRVSGVDFEMERGVTVSGTVRGIHGEAVKGATVEAQKDGGGSGALARYASTGADGAFSTVLPVVAGQKMVLHAFKDNCTSQLESVTAGANGVSGVVLRLVAPGTMVGTVVDEEGQAAAGVLVRATPMSPIGGSVKESFSDEHGGFRIEGLFPGPYQCVALANRWSESEAEVQTEVRSGLETAPVRLVCYGETGGAIWGCVTGSGGRPLANASVTAVKSEYFEVGGGVGAHEAQAQTGPDGHYLIQGLEHGGYNVTASFIDCIPSPSQHAQAGSDAVDFALSSRDYSREALVVTVVNVDTNEPITDCRVLVYPTKSESAPGGMFQSEISGPIPVQDALSQPKPHTSNGWLFARSEYSAQAQHASDGCFRVHAVDPGDVLVVVRSYGYWAESQTVTVAAEPAPPARVTFRLRPGGAIEGMVRTENGTTVSGASVFLNAQQGTQDWDAECVSRSDGTFRIDALPEGTYILSARSPRHALGEATVTLTSAGNARAVITVKELGWVRGRVESTGLVRQLVVRTYYTDARGASLTDTTFPLPDGTFRSGAVVSGPATVEAVIYPPEGEERTVRQPVEIPPGGVVDVDLSFAP